MGSILHVSELTMVKTPNKVILYPFCDLTYREKMIIFQKMDFSIHRMIRLNPFNRYASLLHSLRWAICICGFIIFMGGTYHSAIGQALDKTDSLQNLLKQRNIDPAHKGDLYQSLASAYRQDGLLDSALHYYSIATDLFSSLRDTTKEIKCTNGMAEVYLVKGNSALAREIVVARLPKAIGLGNKGILAQAYNHLGRACNQLGEYEPGLPFYEKALQLSKEAKLDMLIAGTYYGMGMNYYGRSEYLHSLAQYQQALDIYSRLDNKGAMAATYSAMGNVYYDQGYYTKAIQLHIDALTINQELNNQAGVASNYSNIANVYVVQENYEKALDYQTKSLHMHDTIGNKINMATNLYNIGLIYDKMDRYDEAMEAQFRSLALAKETQDQATAIFCYKHLGDLYSVKCLIPEAIEHYEKAISLSTEIGDKTNWSRSLIGLGTIQKSIPKPGPARKNIEEGLSIARQVGIKDAIRDGYYQLMLIDSMSGRYRDALANYKLYSLYNDSLIVESNHKLTHEIQARYEMEKKDHEIALLNQKSTIQHLEINKQRDLKNLLIGGMALSAILFLFIYHYYITRQKLKLQVLRNKIASDLHDEVGSTLSSISIFSQMAKHQSKDITPLLDSIGESSRQMLDAMADIVWTIKPENDQFEKIILRMRSFAYELLGAKNIEFEFMAEDDISLLKLPMDVRKNLYLIFKEATNNLVKYAEANKATFTIREEKKVLSMLIRDNGKGFDINRSTEGNGIKNMRKRAEEIGGRLFIDSKPGDGTTIQLSIAV
jgi:signal transduction histidine kinase